MIEDAIRRLPRRAALATRHGKERWIAPALAELGLVCVVADVDTDAFGTFSGERPRRLGPEATVLAKAAAALAADPAAGWGVATEGSFAPHPEAPWITLHEELVALVARDRTEEVIGRASRFASVRQARVTSPDEAVRVALGWGFPEHGVLVVAGGLDRPAPTRGVEKEARTPEALREACARLGGPDGVWLTSDLRAHRHPPRGEGLAAACEDLLARARESCPGCGRAGFGLVALVPGRRCGDCGTPTDAPRARREGCRHCEQVRITPIPGPPADPGRCPRCNP